MAKNSLKALDCFFCRKSVQVDARTAAVLCDTCIARISDPPAIPVTLPKLSVEEKALRKSERALRKKARLEAKKNAKSGRGRGWHLKQLFESDGEFYSFGKLIDDAAVAKIRRKLKKVNT